MRSIRYHILPVHDHDEEIVFFKAYRQPFPYALDVLQFSAFRCRVGNLDPKTSLEIMEIINKINEEGTTVIMATHDKEIVNKYRKRVITIEKGILVNDKEKGGYFSEKD